MRVVVERKQREEREFCHNIRALVLSYTFEFCKIADLRLISQTLDTFTECSQKEIPGVILLLGAYPPSYYLFKRAELFEKVCLRGFVSYADWLLKQRNLPISRPHMMEFFPKICATGNLAMVQFLARTFTIPFDEKAFRQASVARRTLILEWMLEHYKIQDRTFWLLAGLSAVCSLNGLSFLNVIWTQIEPINLCTAHKFLYDACQYGQLEVVRYLVEKPPFNDKISSLSSLSPLAVSVFQAFRIACCRGHRQVAQALCETPGYKVLFFSKEEKEEKEEQKVQLQLLDIFVHSCKNGQLDVVKWLVLQFAFLFTGSNKKEEEEAVYKAFQAACTEGHLETAKWLQVQFDAKFCPTTFALTCQGGHLKVAEWLVATCPSIMSDTTVGFDAFIRACCFNHVQVAAWIQSCFLIPRTKIITGYLLANSHRKKEITQWLVEKYGPDIQPRVEVLSDSLIRNDDVSGMEWLIQQVAFTDQDYSDLFYSACYCNALQVAQWIVSKMKTPFSPSEISYLTRRVFENGNLDFVQWFMEFFKPDINESLQTFEYLFNECVEKEKWDVLELLVETCQKVPNNILTSSKKKSEIRSKSVAAGCYILPRLN